MSRKIYLKNISLLRKDMEFIYKVCDFFNSDDAEQLFVSIMNMSYKNIGKLKSKDNYSELIEKIIIYEMINNLGVEYIIKILMNNELLKENNIKEKEALFIVLKENLNEIKSLSDSVIPENLNEIIDVLICKSKKKKKIKVLIALIFCVIAIPITLFTFIPHVAYKYSPFGPQFNSLHNYLFVTNKTKQIYKYENAVELTELPIDRDTTINFIHALANDLIIAQNGNAKWGVKEVTPDNINIAIQSVKKYMYNSFLIEMLIKWKEGDFSNATIVHNYIWNILEGNVGYAIAIDEDKVNLVIEKYFNDL